MNDMTDDEIRLAMDRIDTTARSEYRREVTPELIALFAKVSGDEHPIHLDADYAASTPYGKQIAHGAMMVGFMSTASTLLSEAIEADIGRPNVSLGYDRLRFVAPVFAGDIINTSITIMSVDRERLRVMCEETCINQDGKTVAVGHHIMRFI